MKTIHTFLGRLLVVGVFAASLFSCATTTINSGHGFLPDGSAGEGGRAGSGSKKANTNAALERDCRPETKESKAAAAEDGRSGDGTTKGPANVGIVPTARGTETASHTEAPQPGDVRNDVKVVVEKDPNARSSIEPTERRDTKEVAETKPKGREDSYFVVARDGGKGSVYDRKAEEPPPGEGKTESKTEGREEKPADSQDRSGEKFFTDTDKDDYDQKGTASWYGRDFDGRPTASGEKFDSRKLTAAHRTLPLGTIVLVRNMENKKEVILRINDRGPFVKGRVLDISEYGSERLGYKERGLTTVGIRVIRPGEVKSRGAGATKAYYDLDKEESSRRGTAENGNGNRMEPTTGAETPLPQKKIREVKREYRGEETISGYSVQLGVFEKEFNALAAIETLRYLNVPLRVVKRGSLFVVKAGSFSTKESAETLREKLAATGRRVFVTGP